ncbi:MAG: transglycosylase SLT domain-containing protein, partial [Candidatus Limnocylindria bacterium]
MLKTITAAGAGLVVAVVVLGAAAGAGFGGPGSSMTTAQASSEIPADYLPIYRKAAATCPGLPWTVLAAVGRLESDHGRNAKTSSAGAVGPMQFMRATFAAYAYPIPPGGAKPPSPLDPIDA